MEHKSVLRTPLKYFERMGLDKMSAIFFIAADTILHHYSTDFRSVITPPQSTQYIIILCSYCCCCGLC